MDGGKHGGSESGRSVVDDMVGFQKSILHLSAFLCKRGAQARADCQFRVQAKHPILQARCSV